MKRKFIYKGRAHKFGDDINTDDIIPAKYLETTDAKQLGEHCLENVKKNFSKKVNKGDIIVAGKNFGCGSSREHAPLAIKGCGISLVIAVSFARIFFRNSINIGLPIVECKSAKKIKERDNLKVNLDKGIIKNITQGKEYQTQKFPKFIKNLIDKGGLLKALNTKY
jgi:3-isopropylmalate/(R)-2-methylmalate dehydratase small subunit